MKQSLYDWCLENNREDILNRWDYELNTDDPKNMSPNKKDKKFYLKCLNDKSHISESFQIACLLKNKNAPLKCKQCNSFGRWCINNNKQKMLELWDEELNKCSAFDIQKGSNHKYWFKCPRNLHESKQIKLLHLTCQNENVYCSKCNSFAQWGIDNLGEDFLEKYWDYSKNTINPWNINYGSHDKVWMFCQEKDYHGSYEIRCNSFSNGSRCSYCGNFKLHKLDSLGNLFPQVLKIWSNKNKFSPFEIYPMSGKKAYFKCNCGKHNDTYRTISNTVINDFECPVCIKEKIDSNLQLKVSNFINENYNYTLLHENKCTINPKNPLSNNLLRFDNEIKELKLIIEVNGIQHYKLTNFHILTSKKSGTTPQEELEYQKWKDKYKQSYALKYGYYYLEIPYWTEKDESYKQLIDNKIKEIC